MVSHGHRMDVAIVAMLGRANGRCLCSYGMAASQPLDLSQPLASASGHHVGEALSILSQQRNANVVDVFCHC